MSLVNTLRNAHGVGPVCHELDIAYRYQQHRTYPDRCSQREQRDNLLKTEIQRVYDENHSVYGIRKVWRQLLRENISVARCTVARLMKAMGLAGVRRGKKVRATVALCAEQPVVTCEGIGLQHTMIVAKMLLRVFPLPVR